MAEVARTYLCIDLKSFYASVECADRGLDPFATNLVVADPTRGERTICLAITPAMKALGIRNRCRVYEIPSGVSYQKAMPRMRRYMEVSAQIYGIYLRYFSARDIHVYSVDECFIDATPYLSLYGKSPRELAVEVMGAVFDQTRITATAGIGTNLFLAKVALDVTAKHSPSNIGYLDELEFKRLIWPHRPITDVWGIGPGIARRLATYGVHDLMGVALMDEELLYREFGVKAELLRDHAWGEEPVTIADIQRYRPRSHSFSSSQVLPCDYDFDEARMVLREMVDALVLELVDKGLVAGHVSVYAGYAFAKAGEGTGANGSGAGERPARFGAVLPRRGSRPGGSPLGPDTFTDEHGTRRLHGFEGTARSRKLDRHSDSRALLTRAVLALFDEAVDRNRPVRRLGVGLGDLLPAEMAEASLFDDQESLSAERRLARAALAVKGRYGKNALLHGTSLKEKATGRERNEQVGGHHA